MDIHLIAWCLEFVAYSADREAPSPSCDSALSQLPQQITSAPSSAEFHLLSTINIISLAETNPGLEAFKLILTRAQAENQSAEELVPVYHHAIHSVKICDPFLSPVRLQTPQNEGCHLLFHVCSTLVQCGLTSNQLPGPPETQMNSNISINQTSPKCICVRNQKEQMRT